MSKVPITRVPICRGGFHCSPGVLILILVPGFYVLIVGLIGYQRDCMLHNHSIPSPRAYEGLAFRYI